MQAAFFLMLLVVWQASAQITVSPQGCLTPELYNILSTWSLAPTCAPLLSLNSSDLNCLNGYNPEFNLYKNYICQEVDGYNCSNIVQAYALSGLGSCPPPGPTGNCTEGCTLITLKMLDMDVCIPDPSLLYNATCSPCYPLLLNGLQDMFKFIETTPSLAPQIPGYFGQYQQWATVAIQYNAFCANFVVNKTSMTEELCLPLATSLISSVLLNSEVLPFSSVENVVSMCEDPQQRLCLQRGLVGMGSYFNLLMRPLKAIVPNLLTLGHDFFQLADGLCAPATTSAANLASVGSCALKLSEAGAPLKACSSTGGGNCSAECSVKFKTHLSSLGCCAKTLVSPDAISYLTTCADWPEIEAQMRDSCLAAFPPQTLVYVLKEPYSMALAEGDALEDAVRWDFSVAVGVSPDILSVTLKPSCEPNRTAIWIAYNSSLAPDAIATASLFHSLQAIPNTANLSVFLNWTLPTESPLLGFEQCVSPVLPPAPGKGSPAAIGVGITAGILVLTVGAFFVYRRRKNDAATPLLSSGPHQQAAVLD